jgi:bacterioferritin-associated ferredoxin
MVVCVCNAIRERDVREAARNGAMSACQAYRSLGRQPKCGQCVSVARAIIDEERAVALRLQALKSAEIRHFLTVRKLGSGL